MRIWFLLSIFYLGVFSPSALARSYNCLQIFDPNIVHRVCYVSLNNSKERTRAQEIFDKAGVKAEVIELINPGEKPLESIEKNLSQLEACSKPLGATVCDTFVISGHHDGSFRGELVDGPLVPEELLLLSCRFQKTFLGVKSLYLQACNSIDEDLSKKEINLSTTVSETQESSESPIPDSRTNPDYQNTNILRSAFYNANTQGWGMIAPSLQSKSENSLPIDLMVRADFEMWLKEKKDIDGSNTLSKEQVGILFNEYVQLNLNDFRYSSRRSESEEALRELKEYVGDWNNLIAVDPIQCVWDFYQKKYYEAMDEKGRDLRQARSLPSGSNDGLKNFCQDNSSSLKIQEIKNYLEGKREKKPENLEELFKDPQNMDMVVSVLNQVMSKSKDDRRVEELQNQFGKYEELNKYFTKKREKCKKNCLSEVSNFEFASEKQMLTGEKVSTEQIVGSCKSLKKIYSEITNDIKKQPNKDEIVECQEKVTDKFCDHTFRNKLDLKISSLYEEKMDDDTPLKHKAELYNTYQNQVSWCLEKKDNKFQQNRLKTASCKKRPLTNISFSCENNESCLVLALENSLPKCLIKYVEELESCSEDDSVDSNSINKQSEFVHLFNEMLKSGSLDRKQMFFAIPECQEILDNESLKKLPPVARSGVVSIAQENPNSAHIPRNFLDYSKNIHQQFRILNIAEIDEFCRYLQTVQINGSIDEVNSTQSEFNHMLKNLTKDQWKEIISRKNHEGSYAANSQCIFLNSAGLDLPNLNYFFNSVEKKFFECLSISHKTNFSNFDSASENKCCDSDFLCRLNPSNLQFKISPFCKKIHQAKYKTVTIDSTNDPELAGEYKIRNGTDYVQQFNQSMCGGLDQINGGSSNSSTEDLDLLNQRRSSLGQDTTTSNILLNDSNPNVNQSGSVTSNESFAICNQKPVSTNRHVWLRTCCPYSNIKIELKDRYCRSSSYCVSKLSKDALNENLISNEEIINLKGQKCCFEISGIKENYDGIDICENSVYKNSNLFRNEFSAMNWLQMCVNWEDAQSNQENYKMSCNEYFKKKRYVRYFDTNNNPMSLIGKNKRLKYSSFYRNLDDNGDNQLWFYPRKNNYFIETKCLADDFVKLCNTSENNRSKEKCEANLSCVFVPSRYFYD